MQLSSNYKNQQAGAKYLQREEKKWKTTWPKKKIRIKKNPTNDNQNTGQDSKEIRNKTREQNAGNKGK